MVGPAYNTYGKPVGFFPIPVGDWYTFPISFKMVNKDGYGNYFNGFTIDHPTADGVDKNWGDVNENCLKSILTYINTGEFGFVQTGSVNISGASAKSSLPSVNSRLQTKTFRDAFKGAITKQNLRIKQIDSSLIKKLRIRSFFYCALNKIFSLIFL